MNRLIKFHSYKDHPWYHKLYKRLKQEELTICIDFINRSNLLDRAEYERATNRIFMDKEKPRHWKEIMELLLVSN